MEVKNNMEANENMHKISRRSFLGTTTTFSIMATRTALGSEANSKVTAGIVGLGGRGRMIAGMVQNHGGYQIAGVVDYFPKVSQEVGEWLSVAKDHWFSGLHG